MKLILGDSLEKLRDLPTSTVDAVVTDPPYGLSFMGKKWDYDVPSEALWREVYRVMKPGAHLLSFFGTRTYHAGVTRIEAAGFEVRDMLSWLYGSGFPKSLDVSKAIDKAAGAEREVIGRSNRHSGSTRDDAAIGDYARFKSCGNEITAPATDAAKRWQGFGTALKPANEPIVLARKPLEKGLTVAQNVLKWGTGALAIDASRIAAEARRHKLDSSTKGGQKDSDCYGKFADWDGSYFIETQGRWPANVLFDEDAAKALDAQTQHLHGAGHTRDKGAYSKSGMFGSAETGAGHRIGDSGGASRFFYVAKASKKERLGSKHPTIKPVKLMRYLVRMIVPPNGICLDPFMGSGTTGVACKIEGVQFIGIDREEEYVNDARRRIEAAQADDGQLPLEGA